MACYEESGGGAGCLILDFEIQLCEWNLDHVDIS